MLVLAKNCTKRWRCQDFFLFKFSIERPACLVVVKQFKTCKITIASENVVTNAKFAPEFRHFSRKNLHKTASSRTFEVMAGKN